MSKNVKFIDYIINIVGNENVYTTDGECVDEVNDYKSVITDLFEITKNELHLETFQGTEEAERNIRITVNGNEYSFAVEADGWIDNVAFVRGINSVLLDKKSNNRFYFFWSDDSFGQDIGFFFADQQTGNSIMDYAATKNENATGYNEVLQISDGEREEGIDIEL